MGAIPSPFDCYLVLRGLKTLGLRVRQASSSAHAIAEKLAAHAKVERVYYPGTRFACGARRRGQADARPAA
jgi:cystathionine beta-lyase/cystathionine gamma-synthase